MLWAEGQVRCGGTCYGGAARLVVVRRGLLRCGGTCGRVWRDCVAAELAAVRQDLLARLAVARKGCCEMAGRAAVVRRGLLWCGKSPVVRQISVGVAGFTVVPHILLWCGGICCVVSRLAVLWRSLTFCVELKLCFGRPTVVWRDLLRSGGTCCDGQRLL